MKQRLSKTFKDNHKTSNWSNRGLEFIHICTMALERAKR